MLLGLALYVAAGLSVAMLLFRLHAAEAARYSDQKSFVLGVVLCWPYLLWGEISDVVEKRRLDRLRRRGVARRKRFVAWLRTRRVARRRIQWTSSRSRS